MDESRFWSIVEQARGGPGSDPKEPSADADTLKSILDPLSTPDLASFVVQFNERLCDLNRWDLWAVGYLIADGMSDDSFHYFRSWIIGKGRAAYDAALGDPQRLADFVGEEDDLDNELLEYVALELLESRGIPEDPREASGRSPDDEPEGEPFDEETVAERFPELAARFA